MADLPDPQTLGNRVLAALYLQQSRHYTGALRNLHRLGMPLEELAVVSGLGVEEIEAAFREADEMASRPIGRPPGAGGPPRDSSGGC